MRSSQPSKRADLNRDEETRPTMRNPAELQRRRARWMRARLFGLGGVIMIAAGAIVHRAYVVQIVQGPELREMAESQYRRTLHLSPKRGTIFDRHGAELAVSVEVKSVFADPRELRNAGHNPSEVAARLAEIVSIDVEAITRRLSRNGSRFAWIKRQITPRQAQAIEELGIQGIHLEDEARRYYPNRELAAHVLGFANVDGDGIEGLELRFEESLHGSVRSIPAIRDARREIVYGEHLLDDRATQGDSLVLTIDKTIQHIAERELALAVQTFEAVAGSVVVMEPNTGEILAMANVPTFNPNEAGSYSADSRRNRAVTDRFEPGSTVKPFVIGPAIATGAIAPEQLIDCGNGEMQVGEETIHDSHRYERLTPSQVLAFSSNIGVARIGQAMGRRGLYRAFRRFGFGEPTGVSLPGETGGLLRHYTRWYDMDHATLAFGQGMSVTATQLATAMSAFANGGRLMEPILVRHVVDPEGNVVEETLPTVQRQVLPRSISRMVTDMMTAVTGPNGTGAEAGVDGYLVAGKTGTAEKSDVGGVGYAEGKYVANFVGFVPADRPRLVIAVVIDEPRIAYYGGEVAAPAFRRIAEASLRHLGVPSSNGGDRLTELAVDHERDRREIARERPIDDGAVIDEASESPLSPSQVRVPSVVGLPARRALITIRGVGLEPEIEGSGLVIAQDPAPGDVAPVGSTVRIALAPPGNDDLPILSAPTPDPLASLSREIGP